MDDISALPSSLPAGAAFSERRVDPATIAWILSGAVAVLMTVQAAAGILAPAVYRDAGWITAAWYGNDLVTLFVAVPLLVWSLHRARSGSLTGALAWYAMLAYATYNYAYYLFGAEMNAFFLLYAVLFVLPVFALILALGRLDVVSIAGRVTLSRRRGWIAGYMLATGIGLTIAWTAQWAAYLLVGTEPSIGVDAFQLVAAMDLTFIVPWFLVGALLLLRRSAWGYVVAPIIVIQGAMYTLVLSVNSAVAAARGFEGTAEQIPIWAAWTLLGAVAAWGLLRSTRRAS